MGGWGGIKTDYGGHERAYRTFQRTGVVGWDGSGQAYLERQINLLPEIEGPYAPRAGRLLELGCGAGNMTLWFAARGFTAHGIDIAPTAIEMARAEAERCRLLATFTVGNVVELEGYRPAPFDFVYDGHVLHCIIGRDRARILRHAFRLTRPGGYFLIDTMCQPVRKPAQIKGYDAELRSTLYNGVPTRYWAEVPELEQEVCTAGFTVLNTRVTVDEFNDNVLIECRRPA